MSQTVLDKVKNIISAMMNEEHDRHAELLEDIIERLGEDSQAVKDLKLIHITKANLLDSIYAKLKTLK